MRKKIIKGKDLFMVFSMIKCKSVTVWFSDCESNIMKDEHILELRWLLYVEKAIKHIQRSKFIFEKGVQIFIRKGNRKSDWYNADCRRFIRLEGEKQRERGRYKDTEWERETDK